MEKQYYDHRSIKCSECAFHRDEGLRESLLVPTFFEESCEKYGYILHPERYKEDADDCPGFMTREQLAAQERLKKLKKH